MRLKMKL